MSSEFQQSIPERHFKNPKELPVFKIEEKTCIMYRLPSQSDMDKINEQQPIRLEVSTLLLPHLAYQFHTVKKLFIYSEAEAPRNYKMIIPAFLFQSLETLETSYELLLAIDYFDTKIKNVFATTSLSTNLFEPDVRDIASYLRKLKFLHITIVPELICVQKIIEIIQKLKHDNENLTQKEILSKLKKLNLLSINIEQFKTSLQYFIARLEEMTFNKMTHEVFENKKGCHSFSAEIIIEY
jgi:hypothetical protein